jgi:hypothetical protein
MRIDGAVIRYPAPVADLADASHAGVLWRADRGHLLFHVPQVARYLVSGGNLVEIGPCHGAAARTVRRFLRTTPAAALYLQRGIPVLHAAVAVDAAGRAVVLAGDSGSGKSVLLTALLRRGWGLLSDDLAPVTLDSNRVPVALPTWPEICLWPGHTGLAGPTGLAGLASDGGGRGLECRFVREPRPISAIWWLGVHGSDPVETRAVEGLARFDAFGAMAYNRPIAGALLDRGSYLAVAGAVAGAALPIRRLLRPRDRWTADELARLVCGGCPG